MSKPVHGHIDCPTCGTPKGMRITPDKNGKPFGFCEEGCGQQLRVGGNERRVRLFVARYPFASGTPVTVTVPEKEPVPAPVPKAPKAAPPAPPVPPTPKPAAKSSGWFSTLLDTPAEVKNA